MKTVDIEFLYYSPSYEEYLVVAAEAILFKSVQGADSDWDAEDFFEVVKVEAFHKGSPVDIVIPYAVVYRQLKNQIRNAQVARCFNEEGGF